MRVLVACEYSGTVRDAFIRAGHFALSCDLLPSDSDLGPHVEGPIQQVLESRRYGKWDMLIGFPPCTDLAAGGARWWKAKGPKAFAEAVAFARYLADQPIKRIAIENPIGRLSTAWRKPDQIIQPWQHGHGETKATCLWLKGLPLLKPTNIVEGREARIHKMSPSADRWKKRSTTFKGIAEAMASQWGKLQLEGNNGSI